MQSFSIILPRVNGSQFEGSTRSQSQPVLIFLSVENKFIGVEILLKVTCFLKSFISTLNLCLLLFMPCRNHRSSISQ